MDFINKDGKHIYYEVINSDSNYEILVFLNGVMASTSSWVNQYDKLKKIGYKIVLHDFVGQLRSDKFEGLYSFEKHVQDVRQLLQHLDLNKIHLIGTSYGGEVAMKYATMYPDEVKSITVIDSVSELDDRLIRSIEEWIDLAQDYDGENFFYRIMPFIYGYTYIKNNQELLSKRASVMKKIPQDYFDGQIRLYRTFIKDVYMTDQLHKITCPSLIVCGEQDTLKPLKFSKIIAENIGGAQLVLIPDCGHVTIFEKPNELNKYIIEFLNNL